MSTNLPEPICEEISHLISRLDPQFPEETLRLDPFNFGEKRNRADLSTQDGSNTSESVQIKYEVPQNRVFDFQNFNILEPWARNFSLPRTTSRDLTPKMSPNKDLVFDWDTFGGFLIDCCTIWRSRDAQVKVEPFNRTRLKTERKNLVPCYTPSLWTTLCFSTR